MSQSLSQLWIHLIFSTKNRHPFLKDPILRQRVHDSISAICREQRCNVQAIGGVEDHVHILLNLHKNVSLALIIEKIKKSSSKWIKTLSEFDENLSQFYWQRGYGAFSVSQSALGAVTAYIKNQQEHHKKFDFKEELRKIFQLYGVVYDEKYLWD